MEVLGIAASIIAVVQITGQVISTCTRYIEAVNDAPRELRLILIEASALKGLFEPLKVLVACDSETALLNQQLASPVEGCLKAVCELDDLLARAQVLEGSGYGSGDDDDRNGPHRKKRRKTASLMLKLAWPLKQERAKRLLDLIGVYKSTITLLLTSNGIFEIHKMNQEIRSFRVVLDDSVKTKILNWLVTVNPSRNYNSALDLFQKGTCGWALQSDEWIQWKRQIRQRSGDKPRALWIHGIPGAGKTILSAFLVKRLESFCIFDDLGEADEKTLLQVEYDYGKTNHPSLKERRARRGRLVEDTDSQSDDGSSLEGGLSVAAHDERDIDNAINYDEKLDEMSVAGSVDPIDIVCDDVPMTDDWNRGRTPEVSPIINTLPKASVYYYCYHGRGHDETPHFLRWVLNQLCRRASHVPRNIIKSFEMDCQPQTQDLLDAILEVSKSFSDIFISIDAIDESQKREILAELLHRMATEEQFEKFHLVITSRREVDLECHFKDFGTLSMSNPLVDRDIRKYIESQLSSERVFQRWSSQLQEEAKSTLIEKAKGMFRWVACQLQILKKLHLESAVREALKQLPETLDETYERILLNIPAESRQYVWRILVILLSASEMPMEALVSFVSKSSPEEDHMGEILRPDAVQEMASCLILTGESASNSGIVYKPSPGVYVRLAHYTIKEYLTSPRLEHSRVSTFYMPESLATTYVARAMLHTVQKLGVNASRGPEDAFQVYTREHWKRILVRADTVIASDQVLFEKLLRTLDPRAPHYGRRTPSFAIQHSSQFEKLNVLEFYSFEQHDAKLLMNLISLNLYASVATYLLQYTPEQIAALCSATGMYMDDCPLLGLLAREQRVDYLMLLFVRSSECRNTTGLLIWAMETYSSIATINTALSTLIGVGAPVNPSGVRVTPLQIAVNRLQVSEVQLLLESGADANGVGEYDGWCPPRLKHFEGGESPLLAVRKRIDAIEKGLISGDWNRSDAEAIKNMLTAAQAREFCEWQVGPRLGY